MHYLIIWSIRPSQHEKSLSQFHQHGKNTQTLIHALAGKDIEVLSSLHALGEARGYIAVKVSDIATLQTGVLVMGDVYDVELVPCLTDEESARALAPLIPARQD